jgi:spermidine/putrescine transport system substrate-binding protein
MRSFTLGATALALVLACPPFVRLKAAPAPAPVPNAAPLRVLAPVGQFPDWLKASLAASLQTAIDVETWQTPEEAATALAAPNAAIDLALVPDLVVPGLIQEQLLRPLPAARGVKPDHLYLGHYFDRDNRFAWPYALNLAAIAYDARTVKTMPQHWVDLAPEAVARRTLFLDPAIVPALDRKARAWAEAKHLGSGAGALQTAPLTQAAAADAAYQVGNYGELRRKLAGQPDWKFVLPEEGSIIILNHVVLPNGGKNPGLADRALALFMDPANTARLDSENIAAVTQKEALPLVPPATAHDPMLYPTPHLLNNCSFAKK